jgi:hypothetical protein
LEECKSQGIYPGFFATNYIVGKILDCISFNTNLPGRQLADILLPDRRERDF